MLTQPISQVRLTNVALIKYKLHNRKFEIACYKNKAINWRNGIEKDLDEVLQSNHIFTNASQGHLASKDELKKYFPGLDLKEILKIILDNGELQISDKERDSNLENIFKDISNIITEKCVHSLSKRPISVDSVKQAIRDIHFAIKLDQPPKKQALLCLKQLMRKFLIARAEMKIEITCLMENKAKLLAELEKIGVIVNSSEIHEKEQNFGLSLLIEPAKYRIIDNLLKTILKDGIVEVLIPHVANREITDIESAGTVNLEQRPDYEEGDELKEPSSEESENEKEKEKDVKKKKNKKKKHNKIKDHEENEKKEEMKNGKEKTKEIKTVEKEEETKKDEKVIKKEPEPVKIEGGKPGLKCLGCKGVTFENNNTFRQHFKTEWHNFNLKRKIEKQDPLLEEEFQVFQLDKEFLKEKI